ncbi:unnamed protein product [Prunus brigantina]
MAPLPRRTAGLLPNGSLHILLIMPSLMSQIEGVLSASQETPSDRGIGVDPPNSSSFLRAELTLVVGLGCYLLFMSVYENDGLRNRGIGYYEAVKKSWWKGEAEVVEVEGEDHAFHIVKAETQKAKDLTKQVIDFLLK